LPTSEAKFEAMRVKCAGTDLGCKVVTTMKLRSVLAMASLAMVFGFSAACDPDDKPKPDSGDLDTDTDTDADSDTDTDADTDSDTDADTDTDTDADTDSDTDTDTGDSGVVVHSDSDTDDTDTDTDDTSVDPDPHTGTPVPPDSAADSGHTGLTLFPPVIVTNDGLVVDEGSIGNTITVDELEVEDIDSAASEVFGVVLEAPVNGQLMLDGDLLEQGDEFSMEQLDDGLLAYDHFGDENDSDSFEFLVFDLDGGSDGPQDFVFTVLPVNEAPELTTLTGTTIDEGDDNVLIDASMLWTDDVDNSADELTYTLSTAPSEGLLYLDDQELGAGDTFTQQDVDDELLSYDHNGSEAALDSFDFVVADLEPLSDDGTFDISVNPINDTPDIVLYSATVSEGSEGNVLDASALYTEDDDAPSDLVYTLTVAPLNGTLSVNGVDLSTDDEFTQDDVDNNLFAYTHHGGEDSGDGFFVTVEDLALLSDTAFFDLTVEPVNDAPYVDTNEGLEVAEASSGNTIGNSALESLDADNDSADIEYEITVVPAAGTLYLDGSELGAFDTFTQADVDGGLVTYFHDGGELDSDGFDFNVTDPDGDGESGSFAFVVSPNNDTPEITVNAGLSVDEGTEGNLIDNTMLAGEDADNGADELTWTLGTAPVNGTLSVDDFALEAGDTFTQDDIDNDRLNYTHHGDENVEDSLEVGLTDADGLGPFPITFSITVAPVNDAPQVTTSVGVEVDESSTDNVIDEAGLQATDPDDGDDALTFSLDVAPKRGSLYLDGTELGTNDTFTQQQVNDDLLTYDHGGSEGSDSFSVSVEDAEPLSDGPIVVPITLSGVNDAPTVSTNTGVDLDEGDADVTIDASVLEATDPDNEAGELTYVLDSIPEYGELQLDTATLEIGDDFTQADVNDGLLNYDHSGDESETDSFSVTVSDLAPLTDGPVTVELRVAAVNDAPTLSVNNGMSVDEGSEGNVVDASMLAAEDVDNGPEELVFTLAAAPANGSLWLDTVELTQGDGFSQEDLDNGLVSYTHDGDENEADSFEVEVSDPEPLSDGPTTFEITVEPVNDAPEIDVNTGITLDEGAILVEITTEHLSTTDSDNTPEELDYTVVTEPEYGELWLNGVSVLEVGDVFSQQEVDDGLVTYDHLGAEVDGDSFQVRVEDLGGLTDGPVSFDIEVTPVNDAPVITTNEGLAVLEGSTDNPVSSSLLAAEDEDHGASDLTFELLELPAYGGLWFDITTPLEQGDTFTQDDLDQGRLTYDHDGGEEAADSFEVQVSDPEPLTDGPVTVEVTVEGVNDAPEFVVNEPLTVDEGSENNPIGAELLAAEDVDNEPADLTVSIVEAPEFGSLWLDDAELTAGDTFTQQDVDDGLLSYAHHGAEGDFDSFQVLVADLEPLTDGPITFEINVSPVNDAPAIATEEALTVEEGSTGNPVTSDVLAAFDDDNTAEELTFSVTEVPASGTLWIDGTELGEGDKFTQQDLEDGLVTYDHLGDESDSDSFAVEVVDLEPLGDGPVTVEISVVPVNDAPAFVNNDTLEIDEGSEANAIGAELLAAEDVDNDPSDLTILVLESPAFGSLLLDAFELMSGDTFTQKDIDDGLLSYTHFGDEVDNDSFQVLVGDLEPLTDGPVTFEISVSPVNDAPSIVLGEGFGVDEGSSGNVVSSDALAAVDADNTADELTFSVVTGPTLGMLWLDSSPLDFGGTFSQQDLDNGLVTYEHFGDESDSDSFEVDVSDLEPLGDGPVTVEITVAPVNDAPSFVVNEVLTVDEGSEGNVIGAELLAADDADNEPEDLTISVADAPAFGSLWLDTIELMAGDTFTQQDIDDGLLSYTHFGDEVDNDTFQVLVADPEPLTDGPVTFEISVSPVNDAPSIVTNDGQNVDEGSSDNVVSGDALTAFDDDNTAEELTFEVISAPASGTLWLDETELGEGDTFTQQDLDDSLVTYDHHGDESPSDSFEVEVFDLEPLTGGSAVFEIAVDGVNDAPELDTNTGIQVDEGSTSNVISGADLATEDVDNTTDELFYELLALPEHGVLWLDGSIELFENDVFTQYDVDNGLVSYDHFGGESTSDAFTVEVADLEPLTDGPVEFTITVDPVNDPPLIVTNEGISVLSATADNVISAAMLESADDDNTADELTYVIDTAPANGSLWFDITTSLSQGDAFTQEDLDNGRVTYDHAGGDDLADSFDVTVSDLEPLSDGPATFEVRVQPVGSPLFTTNEGTSVIEGAADNIITAAMLAATDPNHDDSELTITIDTAPSAGGLWFEITTSLGEGDTFTQDDLNNGRITYDHGGGEASSDSFEVTVEDPTFLSDGPVSFEIDVTPVNDAPSLSTNTGMTVDEDTEDNVITAAMLEATDADNTAGQLTFSIKTAPTKGSLWLDIFTPLGEDSTFTQQHLIGGRITYDHDGGENIFDSFVVQVADLEPLTDGPVTFDITVTPVNDAPKIVVNEGLSVTEGDLGTLIDLNALAATDDDNDASELIFILTGAPSAGGLWVDSVPIGLNDAFLMQDILDDLVEYDHDGSEGASDTFQVTVEDPDQLTDGPVNFAIAVAPVNDAPEITTNDGLTVDEGTLRNVVSAALLEATDPDNSPSELSFRLTTDVTYGSLWFDVYTLLEVGDTFTQQDLNGGRVEYDHGGGEVSSDSFAVEVADPAPLTDGPVTVEITVNPVNDAPEIDISTGLTVAESGSALIMAEALAASDADNLAEELTFTIAGAPSAGDLVLDNVILGFEDTFTMQDIDDGMLEYKHDGSETTSDSFQVQVEDLEPLSDGPVNFAIVITPVNDAPEITTNDGMTVDEDAWGNVVSSDLLEATDPDNSASELVYTLTTDATYGALWFDVFTQLEVGDTFTQQDLIDSRVEYDHYGDEASSDSFAVQVADPEPLTDGPVTVEITVTPVNDAPKIDISAGLTVAESGSALIMADALAASDADNLAEELTFTITGAPSAGDLVLDNVILGFEDTFTMQDIDDGMLEYKHDGSETTSDSFQVTVEDLEPRSDGPVNFPIAITPVNDAPEITTNDGMTVDEDEWGNAVSGDLLEATDPDNSAGELVYTLTTDATYGSLWFDEFTLLEVGDTFTQQDLNGGRVEYDHYGAEAASDSFAVQVADPEPLTDGPVTVEITVTPVNDAPSITANAALSIDEGSMGNVITVGWLVATDADNSADELTFSITEAPSTGSLWVDGQSVGLGDTFTQQNLNDGLVEYDHDGSEVASDTFEFVVADLEPLTTNPETYYIWVTPVNDAPVISWNTGMTVDENTDFVTITTGELAATDHDNEADELTYTINSAASEGGLWFDFSIQMDIGDTFTQEDLAGGRVSYAHYGSEVSSDSFDVTVSDLEPLSDGPVTFDITVTPVNDQPQINVNNGLVVDEDTISNVITGSDLGAYDNDNSADELTFSISQAPVKGSLWLNIFIELGVGDEFTMQDIIDGQVSYDHNDGLPGSDSFVVMVEDLEPLFNGPRTFEITIDPVNDAPEITVNEQMKVSNGSADNVIRTDFLLAEDEDNVREELTYTLNVAPQYGSLWMDITTPINAGGTFTQTDIDTGRVTYDHAGGPDDDFDVTVADLEPLTDGPVTFRVVINQAPVVTTNNEMLVEPGTSDNLIENVNLEVTDVDDGPKAITLMIDVAPEYGSLWFDIFTPLGVGQTFSQQDLDEGRITYDHSGEGTEPDGFSFHAFDEEPLSTEVEFFSLLITEEF
jgi:hypothetical protein